ncbi:MAG TPA: FtsX-like permease family protein [Polyangiales bacterium]|nr:FtsX-like permease family protein [Polyangiales bacterium]
MAAYALDVGLRYLRSKKRASISVISVIAISGVALGVAALLAVMSITSGFQREFRDKVLGVNAHVLVLKYGLNFDEYREVVARARKMPEVAGAAPFIINEMMLAKGNRLSGVLVKGVDPELMPKVLDLPSQLIEGSLQGLRLPGAMPATRTPTPEPSEAEPDDLDAYLTELAHKDGEHDAAHGGEVAKVPPPSAAKSLPPSAAKNPPAVPKVDVPTPEAMEAALAQGDLAALPDDASEDKLIEQTAPAAPSVEDKQHLPGIVVGATLARELDIHLNDRVKVISPLTGVDTSMVKSDSGRAPKSRDFRVIGIFQAGFQEYDSKLVYVDLYEAQAFADQGDTVVGVEMSLHDIDKSADVALRLERDLGGGPFHTMDWRELNHNLFTALEMQKVMLSLVIATIIFVAAFNVVATLIMIVLEKRREIAILKAMGAKDSAILQIFLVQGAAIGGVGTGIGLLIGGAICGYLNYFHFPLDPKVYLIDHLPIRTSATEFVSTILIALGICVTATLIPSWWAARMLPAEGVRPQ